MNPDQPISKSVIRICPVLSSAITFEKMGNEGKPVRVHDLARSPCIRGECEMFDTDTSTCVFKRV
jgi:hypothetical protein